MLSVWIGMLTTRSHPKRNWPPHVQMLCRVMHDTATAEDMDGLLLAVPHLFADLRTDTGWKHYCGEALVCKVLANTKLSPSAQASLLSGATGALHVHADAPLPSSLGHLAVGLRYLRSMDDCAFQAATAPSVHSLILALWAQEGRNFK